MTRTVWVEDRPLGGRPLENIANKVAIPGKPAIEGDPHRIERWEARGWLWQESNLKRVRYCGRYVSDKRNGVEVRANGLAVGYSGLQSCGSVWACPVCNSKIQALRRLEVGMGLAVALEEGSAAFGAYTLRHRNGDRLGQLWPNLSKCWQGVARDRGVKELRERLGVVGTIRGAEVTVGANGWHPHLHPVQMFERKVSTGAVADLHGEQMRAWVSAAERLGLEAPRSVAQDLHLVIGSQAHDELGQYMAKGTFQIAADSVSWEVTSTQTKSGTRAKASRTPWDLFRDVYTHGDADALDLWHEFEAASKGKRSLTWSRGLRTRLGLGAVEQTDEEVAATVVGTEQDAGFLITDWRPFGKNPRLGAELLDVVGVQGKFSAGREWCRQRGIATESIDREVTQ